MWYTLLLQIEYIYDEECEEPLEMLDPNCDWDRSVAMELLELVERCGQRWKKRPVISGNEEAVLETLLRIQNNSRS